MARARGAASYNAAAPGTPHAQPQRIRPHPVVPRHQGHRACRLRPAVPGRLQHHRFAAVRRRAQQRCHRPVLPARALRGAAAPGRRRPRWTRCSPTCANSSAWTRRLHAAGAQAARAADGQQARPLPERPAVPLALRPARCGDPGDRLQPPGLRRPGGQLRPALPPPAAGRRRGRRGQARAGAPGRGAGRPASRSTWSCWRATCRS